MNPLRLLVVLVLVVSARGAAREVALGDDVRFTVPSSWEQARTKDASGMPTISLKPADDRDARLLITRFPPSPKMSDLAELRELFRASTATMQPPGTVFAPAPVTLSEGKGYWATFEDPDLKGKPVQKENYKLATSVFILLKSGAVLGATLLTNADAVSEFKEGFAIIVSAKVASSDSRPQSDPTKPVVFHAPGLPGALHLPAGYTETPTSRLQSSNYFMVEGGQSVNMSGWIDEASRYDQFDAFWKREKRAMVEHHMPPENERMTKIGDWDAAEYIVNAGPGLKIKNLRACLVKGKVWVDIHISISRHEATWEDLENALKSVSVEAN